MKGGGGGLIVPQRATKKNKCMGINVLNCLFVCLFVCLGFFFYLELCAKLPSSFFNPPKSPPPPPPKKKKIIGPVGHAWHFERKVFGRLCISPSVWFVSSCVGSATTFFSHAKQRCVRIYHSVQGEEGYFSTLKALPSETKDAAEGRLTLVLP